MMDDFSRSPMSDDFLQQQARRSPHAVAVLSPDRAPLSYSRLNGFAKEIGAELRALGIGRHDRVAMALPEGPELAVAFLAVSRVAACAPLNPAYRAGEFDSYLADLNPRVLLTQAGSASPAKSVAASRGIPVLELLPDLNSPAGIFTLRGGTDFDDGNSGENDASETDKSQAQPGAQPDDIALILHTSGTSARPRIVPLSHRNLSASARNIAAVLELTPQDRCLQVMPFFHIHGLSTLLASIAEGASIVCTPGFSASEFFGWLTEFEPTWYSAAPAIHHSILENAALFPREVEHSSLRFMRSASAAMPRPWLVELERIFRAPFIEAYGMTEAAPQIASNRLPPCARKPGSVGRAAGPEVAIRSASGRIARHGENGEIFLRGENVMVGYGVDGNDAAANESAFVEGWFATGDLGYLDADGDLFVTGRAKEIINRGGEKISPLEVEAVLLSHSQVAEAAAFAAPHPTLGEAVAAAIVLRAGGDATETEMRRFCAERLISFKVPQQFVFVSEIPKSATGKIQRAALAETLGLIKNKSHHADSRPDFVSPRTPIEEKIAHAFARALKIERVGARDHFFQLGGDSLTATQAIAWLQHEFAIEIPLERIFEWPTVEELAQLVGDVALEYSRPTIVRRDSTAPDSIEPCQLSFAQSRVWFLDQIEPGNPAYNMHLAQRLKGNLSVTVLEKSLGELVRRHAILRASFRAVDGQPIQIIAPAQPARVPVVDISHLSKTERESEAARLMEETAGLPFHLSRGSLFRPLLLRLGREEHILLLTIHHIVCDGWSMGVLQSELGILYRAFAAGEENPLPALPLEYTDYAAWQRDYLQAGVLQAQLDYWKEHLQNSPPLLALPTDRPRPTLQSYRGARIETLIPEKVVSELTSLGRRENATLFMVMLAAFQTLLFRYSGQDDIVVGAPIANRNRMETEGVVGFFANTLAMRNDLSGEPSFQEVLRRVRSAALGAFAHQEIPFERLVEELAPARDAGRTPLFQVMFAFQNVPNEPLNLGPEFAASVLSKTSGDAKFDLALYLTQSERGMTAAWQYSSDLFDSATIKRMAAHFETLLKCIAANPQWSIAQLPLLRDDERQQLLEEFSQTSISNENEKNGNQLFHRAFEEQAARAPAALAVACGEILLSYGELNARANQLARFLQKRGAAWSTPVGIHLSRSPEMIVAILALLKSGGAYLPLDPNYPAERLAFMLQDARVSCLITEQELQPSLPPHEAKIICLRAEREAIALESEENPHDDFPSSNLAYVIYTSGSTGAPKGVMISHANLSHMARALREALGISSSDRWLHTASFSFSSSVRQFAVALACGASVVIASADDIQNPQELFALIQRSQATVLDIVPSYWRACEDALSRMDSRRLETLLSNKLRLLLSASEPLPADLSASWKRKFGRGEKMFNMFGQTETTGIAAVYEIPDAPGETSAIVPIGRPIADTQIFLLDTAMQPVPVGVAGRMFIGGAGVGAGYLNQSELTAERFTPNFLGSTPGAALYQTGDLARWRADKTIAFVGRQDEQIKLRGFRIEPGEVEFAAKEHPAVRDCIAALRARDGRAAQLVAYVVAREEFPDAQQAPGHADLIAALHDFFKRKLPQHARPNAIVVLPRFPKTPGGKIDRKALTTATESQLESRATFLPANVSVEARLSEIWSELLNVAAVGVGDNFFDLGGDSILGIQMIARANEAGIRIHPRQIFQHQTIRELARAAAANPRGFDEIQESQWLWSTPEPGSPVLAKAQTKEIRATLESLRAYGREALERAGLSPEGAAIVSEVQLEASLRGQATHNIGAIPRYARRISSGAINSTPHFQIERETQSSALLDGDNGPGQWVATAAMELAIEKAQKTGVGVVGARRSNHFGAAGHYAWLAARQNLIGLCTTNGALWLAPTGGLSPTFGNNPLGVGIPSARRHPIVLDVSMSATAKGKIGLHLAEGKPLEAGWIFDQFGLPSIDVADMAAGLGVLIGGHKGYGLALVLEVLAGVLTGAGFCGDHERERMKGNLQPPDYGHFFIAINPELFAPLEEFTARVDRMIAQIKNGKRMENVEEILVPGELEMRARERNLKEGVPLVPTVYRALLEHQVAADLKTQIALVE